MLKDGRKVSATGPIVAEYGLTECTLTRVSFVTTNHWKNTHWFQYWTMNVLYILLRISNFARHMCKNWNGRPCTKVGLNFTTATFHNNITLSPCKERLHKFNETTHCWILIIIAFWENTNFQRWNMFSHIIPVEIGFFTGTNILDEKIKDEKIKGQIFAF